MTDKNNKNPSPLELHCTSGESLKQYLRAKAQNHNHYKVYTQMEYALDICHSKHLYLSEGSKWNDVTDRESFNPPGSDKVNFGKCFSFSASESVAMWMLYGGSGKSGGMIDFTKGIVKILDIEQVELGEFNNDQFTTVRTLNRSDFEIFFTDIVYYSESEDGFGLDIKRSNETARGVKADIINNLSFCKKVYPWNYENECRLIVSIKRELYHPECHHIRIDLSHLDLGNSFDRVYAAPNYIRDLPANTHPSTLGTSLEWDLCKDCNR